jgi:hypothetical protein
MATAPPRFDSRRLHRPLVVVVLLCGFAAVLMLPAMALDDRRLFGVSVWLKPWKFAVSFAIYALTITWMLTLVRRGARLARAAGTVIAVMLGVELALIAMQAARGVPSHFNDQTPFDERVAQVMGGAIMLAWSANLLLALVLLGQRPLGRVLSAGLGWGLGVALFGMLIGLLPIDPMNEWVQQAAGSYETPLGGAHTVGAAEGGPGLPVTNWSLDAGDLRAPHFVGLHALQVLPLAAWLLAGRAASGRLTETPQVALVHVAGGVYLGTVGLLLWQALRAEPVTSPGTATLLAGGLLLAATAAATARILRASPHAAGVDVKPPETTGHDADQGGRA